MDAVMAVYQVVAQHLLGANPIWGERVEPLETVSNILQRPYVCFFDVTSGQEMQALGGKTERITLTVKGVAEKLADALSMRKAINSLLDDSGIQDQHPRLAAHESWAILNVTATRNIYLQELASDGKTIYHAGIQYDILVQEL